MSRDFLLVLACFLLFAITEASSKQSYHIRTKEHTSLQTFQSWIQELDNSTGTQIVHENEDHQGYVTTLTSAEAEEVKQKDFILSVHDIGPPDHAIPPSQPKTPHLARARADRRRHLDRRGIGFWDTEIRQQVFMSWNEPGQPPDGLSYAVDSNMGEDVDLHIIDGGFNMERDVCPPPGCLDGIRGDGKQYLTSKPNR